MTTKTFTNVSVGAAAAGLAATAAHAADPASVDQLLSRIKGSDDSVRHTAWIDAGHVGSAAVKPLAATMTHAGLEVTRAARHALWSIVRHAGRPGADRERQAVVGELGGLLADGQSLPVRRDALWMLSEICGDESVGAVAALLNNGELREDARMVLERIPGAKSLSALKAGLASASSDFKPNIAQSLRARGEHVHGIACQKLVPTHKTEVKSERS